MENDIKLNGIVQSYCEASIKNLNDLKSLSSNSIVRASEVISKSFKNAGKLLICGNGGSASDAQHLAAELVGRFRKDRIALPAIALNTDTSILTSISNDYSFEDIFTRQIEAIGNKNDILLAISTSGNSKNILNAAKYCLSKEIKVIALSGKSGGELESFCDISINVPSTITSNIQEMHIISLHLICTLIEELMFNN